MEQFSRRKKERVAQKLGSNPDQNQTRKNLSQKAKPEGRHETDKGGVSPQVIDYTSKGQHLFRTLKIFEKLL